MVKHAICALCGKTQERNKKGRLKVFNKHHIDYKRNITILLCYTCHSLVHGRLRFGNPWDKKYGKDKGFYRLSKRFQAIYEKAIKANLAKDKCGLANSKP